MSEADIVRNTQLSPARRALVELLVRIDQSLTGKPDHAVWCNMKHQLGKLELIIEGRDAFYLSDGGLSRLVLFPDANLCAAVTSGSTPRVKWLWEHETKFLVQLRNALGSIQREQPLDI